MKRSTLRNWRNRQLIEGASYIIEVEVRLYISVSFWIFVSQNV
jgi:hypothetical protein